jgi:hypothetical protein
MEVGSLVEVSFGGRQLFGVVRWCGKPRNKSEQGLVGVELVQYNFLADKLLTFKIKQWLPISGV